MKKLILIFSAILLASCAIIQKESPAIYISNASSQPINDIRIIWARDNILTLHKLNPGETQSQSFHITSNSDFFGLVKISWTNHNDEGISREIFFKKNHMPNIEDGEMYSYVQIYLEQNDFEILSSDAVDLTSKTRRRDAMLLSYKNSFEANPQNPKPINKPSALIRVETINESKHELPSWMMRAY
jgi:hypothetical protein